MSPAPDPLLFSSATRPRRPRGGRALLAALVAGWLLVGAVGAYHYVNRYWLYRGFPPPTTPVGIRAGSLRTVTFASRALGRRGSYLAYLPAGYAADTRRGRRFPVLYLLHAPPGRVDGFFGAGAIGVRDDVLAARHRIRPMILVVPVGKTRRFRDDTEWADARAGRYEGFVLDVVRDVDHRFATIADRRHRGIAGLSEGGYGAINVGLHHLRAFSVIEGWSGYFAQTPTASFTGASPAQLADNSPADYVPRLAPKIGRLGLRVWLYQGTADQIAPWRIRAFAQELHQAGARVHFGFFPGGHDWGLWRREIPRMLRAASHWFATPPRAGHGAGAGPGALTAIGRPAPRAVRDRLMRALQTRCHVRRLPAGERRPRLCGPRPGAARVGRPATRRGTRHRRAARTRAPPRGTPA